MEFSLPKVGAVGLSIVGFVNLVKDTFIGEFLLWLPFGWGWFGWFFNFVWDFGTYLGAGFFILIFLQWTKNAYILATLGVLFILFVKFGLRAVGST